VAPDEPDLPEGSDDEKVLLLQWLNYLRGAVIRNTEGLDDTQARWTPDGKLISLLGIVCHLTNVEWRWIEGGFGDAQVSRGEQEFDPGSGIRLDEAVIAYRQQAAATDAMVRSSAITRRSEQASWAEGHDLRWVILHLINETARHAGHADATRELLDGVTGE